MMRGALCWRRMVVVLFAVLSAAATLSTGQRHSGDVDLEDLESLEQTPFMLHSGTPYRDMLTIGASQAVAQFASRYQPSERQRITQSRVKAQRQGANRPISPQFYSHTLSQPIGRPNLHDQGLDYVTSRRIRIPEDLRRDRVLADRDEAIILAERDANNIADDVEEFEDEDVFFSSTPSPLSLGLSRPRTSRLRPSSSATPLGNYQTVVGPHGLSYSTNTNYGGYQSSTIATPYTPHSAYSTTLRPRLHFHGFDFSSPAYAAVPSPPPSLRPSGTLLPGRPTVDYKFEVAHGAQGGSYSYSTFG